MHHRLQRVARLVASASGHSVAATRGSVDMTGAERRDEAQQIEQAFRRFAGEPERRSVALDVESTQRAHAQRPGPSGHADVRTCEGAGGDSLAGEGGVRVQL